MSETKTTCPFANSYWGSNGRYEALSTVLGRLIPTMGSVPNPKKNKALERFRMASNAYYDLYNNGLCNRCAEFTKAFGLRGSEIRTKIDKYSYDHPAFRETVNKVDAVMDEIIMAAAVEQIDRMSKGVLS